MKKALLIMAFLIICSTAFGQVKYDISKFELTKEQKNMLVSVAYTLAYENGDNEVPKIDGDYLVFDKLSIGTQSLMNKASVLAKYQAIKASNDQATQDKIDKIKSLKLSIKNRFLAAGFTNEELALMFNLFTE